MLRAHTLGTVAVFTADTAFTNSDLNIVNFVRGIDIPNRLNKLSCSKEQHGRRKSDLSLDI